MDLRRYQHFVALAEEGRFGTAAQRVHLSAAAFSRSIQGLEEEMGVRLFDRGAKGAALTPAGQVVLVRVRALLNDWRSLQQDVALVRNGAFGEIAIGAAPIPAAIVVPDLLAQLHAKTSGLIVRVQYGKLAKLMEQLDAQELDFCIGDPRVIPPSSRFAMERICQPQGNLYCRRDHPLLMNGCISPAGIASSGVALISMTGGLRGAIANAYGFEADQQFPMVCECDDMSTLMQLATQTNVLALLPEALVPKENAPLQAIRSRQPKATQADLHIIWLKDRTLAPAAQRAIAVAKEVGERLNAQC